MRHHHPAIASDHLPICLMGTQCQGHVAHHTVFVHTRQMGVGRDADVVCDHGLQDHCVRDVGQVRTSRQIVHSHAVASITDDVAPVGL